MPDRFDEPSGFFRRPAALTLLVSFATLAQGPRHACAQTAPDKVSEWTQAEKEAYRERQGNIRSELSEMLGLPRDRPSLTPEFRGDAELDGVVVEKWIITSEPGSRIPCLVYRPAALHGKKPAVVLTYGHGASKSHWAYQYAAQTYARLGLVCLAMDPVGEEERHHAGRRGTREHDNHSLDRRANAAGRPVLGKMVFDATRGVDYLMSRGDIDQDRIGLVGNSLGGTVAQYTAALDTRLRLVIVCGWSYDSYNERTGKPCTRRPSQATSKICGWSDLLALSAPHCAVLVYNGDADTIIENRPPVGNDDGGMAWSGNHQAVKEARKIYQRFGGDPEWVNETYAPGGGHREYFATKTALEWVNLHLGSPLSSLAEIKALPTLLAGDWCDDQHVRLER